MKDPITQFSDVAPQLAQFKLASVHASGSETIEIDGNLNCLLEAYTNSSLFLVAGDYDGDSARTAVDNTYASHDVVIAFRRSYIANPDVSFKIKRGLYFLQLNPAIIYRQGSAGYITHPSSEEF